MASRDPAMRSHEQSVRVLRRAGYPDEFILELHSELPDLIDIRREERIPVYYGLSAERLMDDLGGGP